MKGRFFKKSRQQQIPHSASFDSQLSQQQPQQQELPLNCSIDKPGLRPIGECPSPMPPSASSGDVRHLQQLLAPPPVLHSSLCQLSPLSSHDCSSSSQGMIGCANHLFESTGHWELPAEMRLLADSNNSQRRQLQRRHFVEETEASLGHSSALVKCPEAAPIVSKMCTSMASRAHGNQVADLVFTLAQQLSSKDDEISRLRSQLRKSEGRWERQWREMERELERKAQELDGAREQLSRMRRRLRGCEAELEMASRQQPRGMVREEGQQLLELERRKLEAENQQLKDKLTREAKLQADRELQWERERMELKQSVQSLNGALEELESELRQREVREREMQLTLERRLVEREIGRMGVGGREDRETANSSMVDLPSPKTDSSLSDGLCCPSASASNTSGLGSLLAKELPDQKQLDKLLAKARWRLAESRAKIAQLIQTAEKTQRGERLSRQDLFGTSLSTGELQQREDHQLQHPSCWSASASVDEHLKQIAAIQRDLELLHDKFTILYAKGIFGR